MNIITSAVSSLIPKDSLQVGGPGFLPLHAGGFQGVRVLTLPPAEPNLKTQAAHDRVMSHADVTGLREKTQS